MNYQKESQFCAAEINEKMLKRVDLHLLDVLHGTLGISGEISEIHEAYDNVFYDDNKIDLVNLQEELGDICWYLANLATALGYEANWQYYPNKNDGEPDFRSFLIKSIKMSAISGKVVDFIKRKVYYGVDKSEDELKGYIDSMIKLVCGMAQDLTIHIDDAKEKNLNKLKERYGKKFSEKAAVERNIDKEREVLENDLE